MPGHEDAMLRRLNNSTNPTRERSVSDVTNNRGNGMSEREQRMLRRLEASTI